MKVKIFIIFSVWRTNFTNDVINFPVQSNYERKTFQTDLKCFVYIYNLKLAKSPSNNNSSQQKKNLQENLHLTWSRRRFRNAPVRRLPCNVDIQYPIIIFNRIETYSVLWYISQISIYTITKDVGTERKDASTIRCRNKAEQNPL